MAVLAKALMTAAQLRTGYLLALGSDTSQDALLEVILNAISDTFDRYVGRALAKAAYTAAYLDGNGRPTLYLPNRPVVSITSIEEDDETLTEGEEYNYMLYAEEGKLVKTEGGIWMKGPKTIKITYTAGYVVQGATPEAGETALPADLWLACAMQAAREWKKAQQNEWGMTSKSSPDGATIQRVEAGLMKKVREILDKYRSFSL